MKVGFLLFSFYLRIEGFLIGWVQMKERFFDLLYVINFSLFPSPLYHSNNRGLITQSNQKKYNYLQEQRKKKLLCLIS